MNQILVNKRTRILKDQVIHINRHLPSLTDRINVRVGDEVTPDAILAEGKRTAGFRTINLAAELGVNVSEALKFLTRPMGSSIFQDELLASKKGILGLGEKKVLAPDDGLLDFYDQKTGVLKIKLLPKVVKLACGVFGMIDEINAVKGTIVIRTMVDLIYGMTGSGKEREGTLNLIGSKEVLIGSRQLEDTMKGQIIVGGEIVFGDGLEKAMEIGIAGIISGGINAKDYKSIAGSWNINQKQWSDIGFSLLVTEGFGAVPMGDDIFSLLQKNAGNFSILDGNRNRLILPSTSQNSMIYIRKTKLPEGSLIENKPELISDELQLRQLVRIIGLDNFGTQGFIEAIDKTPTKLPSGIVSNLVTVNIGDKKFRVAYQNIEAIN